jgi:hypothetical protein
MSSMDNLAPPGRHWDQVEVIRDFLSATVSDTHTVRVQVVATLTSLVFAVLILAFLGYLVLPVIFVLDVVTGTALERCM